ADFVHHRFDDLVRRPLSVDAPLFAALGSRDLSDAAFCQVMCTGTRSAGLGASLGWRESFARAPAPWGAGPAPATHGDYTYVPVPDPAPANDALSGTPLAGAHTHYALDVLRSGTPVLRIVFLDTSLKSLQTDDPVQNPLEPQGQLAWLQAVTCV